MWEIIKKAIQDIEQANNIKFGNESWQRIKQMESDLIKYHLDSEREIHQSYMNDQVDYGMRPKRNPYDF